MSEYLVDLGIDGRKLLQDSEGYRFTQDSVFVANMAKIDVGDRVLDLGSGGGILSILALVKRGAAHATGIEIQQKQCELSLKSARLNGLEDKFDVINGDVRDIRGLVKAESFDKVLCNPPYFTSGGAEGERGLSRCESGATLDDFVAAAAWALKFGGDACFVIKVARLATLFSAMTSRNLQPKHMTLIFPKLSSGADAAVVSARKGGKEGLTLSTFVAKDEDGKDTQQYRRLYGIE